jgi:hypothetical protein
MSTRSFHIALIALGSLGLAALAGCGASQKQEGTVGSSDIPVTPREVSGSNDANPATPAPPASPASPAAPSGKSSGTSTKPDNPSPPDPTVQQVVIQAGMRNFEQVNATMSALTGVSQGAVSAQFATLTTALPTDTDVQSFVGSNQVSVFKLAVEYCNAVNADPTKVTAVFGQGVTTTGTLGTVFSDAGKTQIATSLVNNFWGSNLATNPPEDQSVAQLTQLMDDLLTGKDLTSATLTPAVLTAVCSAALSTAQVTLF